MHQNDAVQLQGYTTSYTSTTGYRNCRDWIECNLALKMEMHIAQNIHYTTDQIKSDEFHNDVRQ